MILSALVRINR